MNFVLKENIEENVTFNEQLNLESDTIYESTYIQNLKILPTTRRQTPYLNKRIMGVGP